MLFDMHNDFLTAEQPSEYGCGDAEGCCTDVVYVVWATKLRPDNAAYKRLTDKTPQSPAYRSHNAVEDVGAVRVRDYDKFFSEHKPLYASLTWNCGNPLAGGVGSGKGLTKKGREVVRAMERCDVALDLSHLCRRSFWEALDYAEGKVLVSHTAADAVYESSRNLTAEQMKAVAAKGGIIGIFAAADFLSGGVCTENDYIRHLRAACETVGAEHVGIGTDFFGTKHCPDRLCCYNNFSKLADRLQKIGFTKNEINKIFHINAENFFGLQEKQ